MANHSFGVTGDGGAVTAAILVNELYHDAIVDTLYYNNFTGSPALNMDLKPQPGGTGVNWVVRKSGSSPEIFVEHQGQPSAAVSDYVHASVDWTYFRSMVQVTGHARDAMRSAYARQDTAGGPMDLELLQAARDITDLMNTTYLGATYGLTNAVSATGTYAGITRGAATYFESLVTAVNRDLEMTDLLDAFEALEDNDRGGKSFVVVCPLNQRTRLFQLSPPAGMKVTQPGNVTAGFYDQLLLGKWPVLAIGDLDDSTLVILENSNGNNFMRVIRPFEAKEMSPSGDSDIVQLSTGNAWGVRHPKVSAKLTGLSA